MQKNHHDRLGGNTGPASRALERNLFNVRHDRPLPLLDLTLGEVPGYLYNFNKSRIPRCRLPAGRQGSVPGGSAHCNNEVKYDQTEFRFLPQVCSNCGLGTLLKPDRILLADRAADPAPVAPPLIDDRLFC